MEQRALFRPYFQPLQKNDLGDKVPRNTVDDQKQDETPNLKAQTSTV